jgi:hypothetical protein
MMVEDAHGEQLFVAAMGSSFSFFQNVLDAFKTDHLVMLC